MSFGDHAFEAASSPGAQRPPGALPARGEAAKVSPCEGPRCRFQLRLSPAPADLRVTVALLHDFLLNLQTWADTEARGSPRSTRTYPGLRGELELNLVQGANRPPRELYNPRLSLTEEKQTLAISFGQAVERMWKAVESSSHPQLETYLFTNHIALSLSPLC